MLDYKQKLKDWNNTEQYKSELEFLFSLINPLGVQSILDYGCGVGTAMKYLRLNSDCKIYGYDITDKYYEGDSFWFRTEIYFKVDIIFFMHSIAHISKPPLPKIKDEFLLPDGRVIVITPNIEWLTLKNKGKEIKTDDTVVQHYSSLTLENLFKENAYDIICQGQFGNCINNQHERLFLIAK